MNGYLAIVERDEQGGFSAWIPDLPGCVATAHDYDGCLSLLQKAINLHLQGMREDGEEIPAPTTVAVLTITAAPPLTTRC